MKRVFLALVCLAVPGMFFLNAWQGYRYDTLDDEVRALEKEQKELLMANQDAIGQIAYETSPDRVAEKAAGLGLAPAEPAAVTRVQSPQAAGDGGSAQ